MISLLIIACTFTACDALSGDCQVCRYASYDSANGETTYTDDIEYCGTDLIAMKAIKPVTTNGVTTSVQCY